MRAMNTMKKLLATVLALLLAVGATPAVPARAEAPAHMVLTLGANLTQAQKQYVLDYLNVREDQVEVVIVTNADEHKLLDGQYTKKQIGSKTLSCALVNPTASGGIQAKTANLNVVTSDRIIGILQTAGVNNCEVLAVAPYMVSGTGALTGVMMAYERAIGQQLDPQKQQMSVVESKTVSQVGERIGQDEATLVVNDIKIRIVRDNVKEDEQVVSVVDQTVADLEAQLASLKGASAPKLDQSNREALYDYGRGISALDYNYDEMKVTLQRVTTNLARKIGIQDPIESTFEDLGEDVLPENSILRATNDESLGKDANITATHEKALEVAPTLEPTAEPTPEPVGELRMASQLPARVTGVSLERVRELPEDVTEMIHGTSVLCRRRRVDDGSNTIYFGGADPRYFCALADLEGNLLTDYLYYDSFKADHGLIHAEENRGEAQTAGVLSQTGQTVVPFQYFDTKPLGMRWAAGVRAQEVSESDGYDYYTWSDPRQYFAITALDIYYYDGVQSRLAGTLDRQAFGDMYDFSAQGEFLNVRNRDGIVTYDSTFTPVWREATGIDDFGALTPGSVTIIEGESNYLDGLADADGNVILAPAVYFISTNIYDCAVFYTEDSRKGALSLNGELLLPPEFKEIDASSGGPLNPDREYPFAYCTFGYFMVSDEEHSGYAAAGGEITCPLIYDRYKLFNQGAAGYVRHDDDTYSLVSADGVQTDMAGRYSYISCLNYSSGMLWEANGESGYDLLDWHGQPLLEQYSHYILSGDGRWLYAKHSYDTPAELYRVDYHFDGEAPAALPEPAPEVTPEPAPEATPEPAPEITPEPVPEITPEPAPEITPEPAPEVTPEPAPEITPEPAPEVTPEPAPEITPEPAAAPAANAEASITADKMIEVLQSTVDTLQTADFDGQREKIAQILATEISLLRPLNGGAADLLELARATIETGGGTLDTTLAALNGAISMLKGE